MDKKIEELLIRKFFKRSLQDRVLFELFSRKKRKNALSRLCHNYDDTLNKEYMTKLEEDDYNSKTISDLLKKLGSETYCYVISWDEGIDGKQLSLQEALDKVVGLGMPSIISCIHGELAYFEGEHEYGSTPRYILKQKVRKNNK
ncbi:hypothetical protein AAXE64_29285 [Priestia megaterium]